MVMVNLYLQQIQAQELIILFSIQAAQELKVIVGQAGDKLYIGGTISTERWG